MRARAFTDRWAGPAGWALALAAGAGFVGVFFAWPVAALVGRGFVDPAGQLDLSGFSDVLSRPATWTVIGRTFAQAGAGTIASIVVGLPGAYVVSRLQFQGRGLLRAWMTVPFVLPTVVVGAAFRSLLGAGGPLGFLGWDRTAIAVLVGLVFFNYAVVVRIVGAMWERLDPRSVQAARTLGASPARAFFTVTLPQLGPSIAAAGGIVFLFCSTAFGVVMVLGGRRHANLEAEIYRQTTQLLDLRVAAVLSVVQLVVIAAALLAVARLRRRSERALNITAAGAGTHRPRRADAFALAVTAIVIGLVHVLPLGSLVVRSFRTEDGWGWGNYAALATTGGRGGLNVTLWQALATSARLATFATVIAMVVALLLVCTLARPIKSRLGRRIGAVVDGAVMLPLGVSAVTVGFGLLITMNNPLGLNVDLRSSGVLIAIAQGLVALPLVVRVISPVVRAIDPRLRQSAAVLGAGPWRILRTIDVPIAARSIGLGMGFAFAASLGEFGASSFLVRPGVVTLPVAIYQLLGKQGAEHFGMAMAAAVVLGLVTTMIVVAVERIRPPGAGEF
ncbi:ABC transporter permease [Rarobacter incanus]|nr:iron ABC transporter permease [Rarobacter incanus]